jgi:O-antigen/teichoic acid export membrane protein
MTQKLTDKITNAFRYTLLFKTLGQIFSVTATILLVKALSENDYGIYNLLYSVIGLIGTIASLGLHDTLQRFIPEYYQKGKFSIANTLFQFSSALRLVADIAVLGFLLLFWQEIAPILKLTAYKQYFMFFTLVAVLHQQRSMLEICLSSYFLHKSTKALNVLFPIFKVVGYGYIIFAEKNLWWAILIDLLAHIMIYLLLRILYHRKVPISGGDSNRLPREEKKRLTRYAFFYNFNNTGTGLLNADFDNFIIVMMLNPVAVGAYSFYSLLSINITAFLPLRYFKGVIIPAFFALVTSSKTTDSTTQIFQWLVKMNLIFAVPCFFFLLLFTDDLVFLLFDNKFIEFSSILSMMFFFSILNSVPVGTVAQLKEKADIVLYSKIFAVYNLIAGIILIKFFGIWGVAFATGTAILAKNCFVWYFVRKEANLNGMGAFFLKIILFWVTISFGIHNINQIIPTHAFYQLFLGTLIFTITFFIQFRCNYFKDFEKKVMADLSGNNLTLLKLLRTLKLLPDLY